MSESLPCVDIIASEFRGYLAVLDFRPEAEYGYRATPKEVLHLLRSRGLEVEGVGVMTPGIARRMARPNPKRRAS